MRFKPLKYILIILVLLSTVSTYSQNKKQQELEERRQEILKEIQQFSKLVSKGKKDQRSALTAAEDLDYKVSVRQNLIKLTNQQANLLTREINDNQNRITQLRDKLKVLKEEYAAMIVKSYKSKSEQSKVMFLLASNNFQQAYKRLQYIKQFADYQKKQSQIIREQTLELQELNKNLILLKEGKQQLINDNRLAKNELDKELQEQKKLISSIKSNLNAYHSQIKEKQREAERIDKEILKLIREARANSNKKAGKSASSTSFALTPEDKALADNFTSNKGKLPWPVEEGVVKMRFGNHPSPIDRTITIKSNGVRIATNSKASVRAVFEGTVNSVIVPKNGNITVMIQHGNYFTVYKNLSRIFVKKGDKVSTKQKIGEVLTSKSSGETILSFLVFRGLEPQNPSHWVYKM
ncbi:MAG: peptidoglycan DD-metalloendopeptidase family protein [Bacteroidia bacterium]|nr:peptidoglycan DD-metalloendopeptidase family protein [Bacteroidia bacterium]NND25677.1 peptidoglycan DD-metalloendopeptidase family protein [Flavobacteriaceae bacterium]MBT8279257.1 peptidoglycan DD-metalloendopeptidase family protein [Bacteroidia bacterium]NNK59793.1 peptidoglycan DD-metalloendopeptidase family protein [Flavobacteriaceae bacterium]NNL32057.1 peptidoglycan DD-metalloendopeptidase family protein [Flavobacteriaceae bacterium]